MKPIRVWSVREKIGGRWIETRRIVSSVGPQAHRGQRIKKLKIPWASRTPDSIGQQIKEVIQEEVDHAREHDV